MKVRQFSLFLVILLVLSIQCIHSVDSQRVPSITSQPVYQQSTNTTISLPCTIDGDYCSVNATCKTTIINPDGDVLVNNYAMVQNNAVFEVNLSSSQTNVLGEYEFNVVCSDNGDSVSRFLRFHITPNGELPTTASGILYIGLFLLLLIFLGFLVYGFIVSDKLLFKFLLFHFGYIVFISILFIAWNMSANYFMSISFITAFFRIAWFVFFIAYFPLILVSFVWIGYMMLNIKEIEQMMERGVPEDEAWARKTNRRWK